MEWNGIDGYWKVEVYFVLRGGLLFCELEFDYPWV